MKPFVHVIGSAALLAGCIRTTTTTHNPPQPPQPPPQPPTGNPPAPVEPPPIPEAQQTPPATVPEIPPIANPPAPLPTWDEVQSSHPKGATNPPFPVLYIARDTNACFKAWLPSMIPPPADIRAAGGRVYEHAAEVSNATQVACPEGQPAALMADWAKAMSGGQPK